MTAPADRLERIASAAHRLRGLARALELVTFSCGDGEDLARDAVADAMASTAEEIAQLVEQILSPEEGSP